MTSSFLACVLLTVTLPPTIFALPDRPGTGFDDSFNGKQCDLAQGEVYLPGPSGKRADIAACKKSCEDEATCQSITFYKVSGWCSHFSSRCEKTGSAQGHAERVKDFTRFNHEECDWAQGEVYLPGPSGKRANIAECKKSCEDEPTCQSITFFREGWCSHFSSRCEKTKTVRSAHAERLKDFGKLNQEECDADQGEVYLPGPSGKRANLPACKKSCEDTPACKSITFFRDGLWCSHFSSRCEKTKTVKNAHAERVKDLTKKIFEGHCDPSGYLHMFENSDNPGKTVEQRVSQCAAACLSKKTPLGAGTAKSWTGFVAKGFIVITDPKYGSSSVGRCHCASADSSTCKRQTLTPFVRYDFV